MRKIIETAAAIEEIDPLWSQRAQTRLDNLTKPRGSLGKLEDLAQKVAGIMRAERPQIPEKVIITMAADHGVAAEGVSAYPPEVTAQMVYNFLRGGAGINVLARHVGARVVVVDMGVAKDLDPHPDLVNKKVAYGTKSITKGPAMERAEAIRSIEAGIEVAEAAYRKGMHIVGTGDMGIGNTTASSAIVAALTGEAVAKVTGRGTGIDDRIFGNKVQAIERALQINRPNPHDALDVLAKVGGFEIGGLVGVILSGASLKIPVVIDGFISGAAALIALTLESKVRGYLIASHRSAEPGHQVALQHMGLEPLLQLSLRLGEGTGAALGVGLVEAAVRVLNEMATFREAGVSERAPR